MARKRTRNSKVIGFAGFREEGGMVVFRVLRPQPVQSGTAEDGTPIWSYHREFQMATAGFAAMQINGSNTALETANGGPLTFEVHVRRKDGSSPPYTTLAKVDVVFGERPADGQWPSQQTGEV